jgi:hypothetical protein
LGILEENRSLHCHYFVKKLLIQILKCSFLNKNLTLLFLSTVATQPKLCFFLNFFKKSQIKLMKRTWLLAALFLLLGAGAYYALQQKKQTGSTVSTDMDFAIDNAADVAKIFIANRNGETATVERKDGFWLYNGKYKARPSAIEIILQTLRQIKVSYIAPKAADPVMIKSIAADGITVEVWNKEGKRIKRFYIGGVTNDERGTYAIMDGSEQPYVVHIPSFIGSLRGRFMIGDEKWRDKNIFGEKLTEIQAVSIEYPLQKSQSFKLEKQGNGDFMVNPYYATTTPINRPIKKGLAEAYLIQFENKVAEAFESNNPLRDSVVQQSPFAIIRMKKTDGTEKKARFFPVGIEKNKNTGEGFVARYFVDIDDNKEFMLTQDRVFGTIFRGLGFFFEGKDESVEYKN